MTLAWLALSFLAGVAAGSALPGVGLWAVLVALPCALAWRIGRLRLPLLCAAACLVGLARSPHSPPRPTPADVAYYNGRAVQVLGTVAQEPDVRDSGTQVVLDASAITVERRTFEVRGKVEIHLAKGQTADYGEVVSATGKLLTPSNGRVPYANILALRGIRSTMNFPKLLVQGTSKGGPLGWVVPFRQLIERNINRELPEPEAALLIALALGAHSASLGDFAPQLVNTGLIHLIAISGIKVAMVAGILYAATRRFGSPRLALAATVATMWLYVLLTGMTTSGERSAAMWTLVFVGVALGRGTVSLVSLSAVAAVMVALQPALVWDTPFLLTSFGTAAIIAFSDPLMHWVKRIPSPFRESVAVTLAAQIGTFPVVVAGFHVVSLTGPIANALVLPMVPFLILAGFLVGLSASVTAVSAPLSSITYSLLHGIVLLVTGLASWPGAPSLASLPGLVNAAYYAVMLLLGSYLLRRRQWAPPGRAPAHGREITLSLMVGLSLATVFTLHAEAPSSARVVWLGSGESILVTSGKATVLIDGSPRPFQLLRRLSSDLPYGTRTIGAIVVTDPGAFNVSGLRAVVSHYSVGEIVDVGAEYPTGTYAAWRADVRASGIPAYALRTGLKLAAGAVSILAVSPPSVRPNRRDSVGMLLVRAGDRSILLAGDASREEQLEAAYLPVKVRAQAVLLWGTTCDRVFLDRVRATTIFAPSCRGTGAFRRVLPGGNLLAVDRPTKSS